MKVICVNLIDGLPGSGKTSGMLDEIATVPGRYVLAAPRTALAEEHIAALRSRITTCPRTSPTIIPIHSDQSTRGSVKRRIADACRELAQDRHAVVVITHEGLQSSDPTTFSGWHARIDETPDALASGKLNLPVGAKWLDTLYTLVRVDETKWSKVTVKSGTPPMHRFTQDDFAKEELAGFHKRVLSPAGVYVDLDDWTDAVDRSRSISWWSLWSPLDLSGCASITIAASGFHSSLCALATTRFYPDRIDYRSTMVEASRTGHPTVRISYFTQAHTGTTSFWEDGDGKRCLAKVGRYLGGVRDLGFWSGNKLVRDRIGAMLQGHEVLPRQAGTNAYRDLTSCAFIYSSKAQDSDAALLEQFGLTKDDIRRAREIEDIHQFVMRGAIRCPEFSGHYDIYVYDRHQAEALAGFLTEGGLTDVGLFGIDEVGIMDFARPRPGRKLAQLDEGSKAERDAKRREKDAARKALVRKADRARKKRNGTYREPGRPLGATSL